MKAKTLFWGIALALLAGIAFAQTSMEIISVEAKLEQKNIVVEIIALNKGAKESLIKTTTNYLGQTDEWQEIVPANSTKKFTFTIHNAKPGTMKMAVENGVSKFVEIRIPENQSDKELFVREITAEDYSVPPIMENKNTELKDLITPYNIAVGAAAIALALVFALMLYKWRKRAPEEKRMEKNAELLKEADEARKERSKIKKIQL